MFFTGCETQKKVDLSNLIDKLEESKFFNEKGVKNLYTRNNIFIYSITNTSVTYSIENNELKFLKIDSEQEIDSAYLRQEILEIIELQNELEIIGFENNESDAKFYCDLNLIEELPIQVDESDNMIVLAFTNDENLLRGAKKFSPIPDKKNWFLQSYNAKFGLPNL